MLGYRGFRKRKLSVSMAEQKIQKETQDEGTEARVYELGYHLVPALREEELPAEVSSLRSRIEALGGVFIADEFPRSIPLAYTMFRSSGGRRERFNTAYFGWVKFEMDPSSAEKLAKELRGEKKLVRFIVIKTVRENTMIPKRLLTEREENEALRKKEISAPREEEKSSGNPVSDEELDKTIEGLVVQ